MGKEEYSENMLQMIQDNSTLGCINGSRESRARVVMTLPNSLDLSIYPGICVQYNKQDMDKPGGR